jgi:cell pole-organizing protein PopZ
MTEKTLSILGVIKKKLDNLDRNAKNNVAPDLSSEFDYVVPAKKNSDSSLNSDQNSANTAENNSANNQNQDNKINEYSLGDLDPKAQEANQTNANNQEAKPQEDSANTSKTTETDNKKDDKLDIALTNFDEELESIIEEYEDELSDADLDGGSAMNSIFNITLRQAPKTDDHEENFGENNDSILIDFSADNSASSSEETGNNNFNNNDTANNSDSSADSEFGFDSDLNQAQQKLFGDSMNLDFDKANPVDNNSSQNFNNSLQPDLEQANANINSLDINNLQSNLSFREDDNKNLPAPDNSLSHNKDSVDNGHELDFNLSFNHDNHLDFSFDDHNNNQEVQQPQAENHELPKQDLNNNLNDLNFDNTSKSSEEISLADENALKKQQIISDFEKDVTPQIPSFNANENPINTSNRMLSALKGNLNINNNTSSVQQNSPSTSDFDDFSHDHNNSDFELSDLELAESKMFSNSDSSSFDQKSEIKVEQKSQLNLDQDHAQNFEQNLNQNPKQEIDHELFHDNEQINLSQSQLHNDFANTLNINLAQNNLFNEPNKLGNNFTQDSQNSSPTLRQNIAIPNFVTKENSQENLQKTNPQLANFINDLEHHADNDQNHLSQFINHQDNSQNNNFLNISNQHIVDHDSDMHHQADQQIDHNQHNLQNTNLNYQPQVSKPLVNEDVIIQSATSVQQLLNAKTLMSGINNFMQSPYPLEIAIQLMEPKLEQWLNENLSQIVEKVVRDEIKRIMPK